MSMQQQFRSAPFGGFHRQDVLNYIEASARKHTAEVEALRRELERTKQELEEARARAASAEAELDRLAPQAAQAERSTAELEEKRSGLAMAELELRQLRAQNAMLQTKAEAYEAVKEKTGGIELEAHQRAKRVVEEAQQEADNLRFQTKQWLAKVRSSYERLRTDVEASITRVAGELEQTGRAVAALNQEFREHDAMIQELAEELKKE